ncbi:hypothetical protein EV702DRAFT_1149219 [Suillus placidus]|uniref:Uncharacterized protein n=1 Tax=Suillus placidus TaxID=48579 RepID=A0A9P6ZIK6_9AGAM|nr:hypothetical protein EV702DRAFT_1149219 [Suillus placidus]
MFLCRGNLPDLIFELAFLICKPNIQITTRKVCSNGLAFSPTRLASTTRHFGIFIPNKFAMMMIDVNAGLDVDLVHDWYGGLWTHHVQYFLFGREQVNNPLARAGSIMNLMVLPTTTSTFPSMLQWSSKGTLLLFLKPSILTFSFSQYIFVRIPRYGIRIWKIVDFRGRLCDVYVSSCRIRRHVHAIFRLDGRRPFQAKVEN